MRNVKGRPLNHVEKEMAAMQATSLSALPLLTEAQLTQLEAALVPRCYNHNRENLEDHIQYGGMVLLAGLLRDRFEAAHGEDDPLRNGERA